MAALGGAFMISEKGLRVAMIDTVLQADQRRERLLIEQMREKQTEVYRIQRDLKRLAGDLLIVQRQQAALVDAIALEFA